MPSHKIVSTVPLLLSLILLFSVIYTGDIMAQGIPTNKQSKPQQSKLQLEFDPTSGNIFYTDFIGLEASLQLFSPGTFINPNDYILGANDLLGIVISGTMILNYRALGINTEGEIIVPSIGTIKVGGLSLTEARALITKEVEKNYRNVQISVSIDKPRPLSIYISGDIPYPGRIAVPYGTRLDVPLLRSIFQYRGPEMDVNAGTSVTKILYPSFSDFPGLSERADDYANSIIARPLTSVGKLLREEKYQLRDIQIKRSDGSSLSADMFSYFYGGNIDANPVLLNDDHIIITSIKHNDPQVSVSGAVNVSMRVPYRSGDTVESLISISGGFSANADTTRIIVFRPNNNSIEQISLSASSSLYKTLNLQPYDRVVVSSLPIDKRMFSASVVGRVAHVGIYPIIEGNSSVYDLLQMASGPLPDALLKGAYIKRTKETIQDNPGITSVGFRDVMRGSDQMIQGLSWLELEQRVRKNRIYLDLGDQEQLKRIRLMDGDSLIVPQDLNTVYVYGQVDKPGFVEYEVGQDVDFYINESGGFSISSNPKKIYVIKAGTLAWSEASNATIESGDMVYVDRILLDDNLQRRAFIRQSQSLYTSIVLSLVTTTLTVISFFRN
jgi:protein involved in polysaccharide export with SLBB domain